MKDYAEFMVDALEWQANRPRFYIDELLPNSTTDYGIIAGRTGRGKTAEALYLALCLATGNSYRGYKVERIPVGYLGFEGNQVNITERLQKLLPHFPTPDSGYFSLDIVEKRYRLKGNVEKLAKESKGLKLLILDRVKGLVHGDYVRPNFVNEFVEDLREAQRKLKIVVVLTLQVRKEHAETKVKTGDLDKIKGAADYVEDATFVILLERPNMKSPPEEWCNLYFAKHREARKALPNLELRYDYEKAMFVPR